MGEAQERRRWTRRCVASFSMSNCNHAIGRAQEAHFSQKVRRDTEHGGCYCPFARSKNCTHSAVLEVEIVEALEVALEAILWLAGIREGLRWWVNQGLGLVVGRRSALLLLQGVRRRLHLRGLRRRLLVAFCKHCP